MQETEGVIKYHLNHRQTAANPDWSLAAMNSWRGLLYKLELIGQNPARYMGYGYGNISQRFIGEQFIISGTQTGGISKLLAQHYCLIEKVDLAHNQVDSSGPCQPSSEALTHASLYAQSTTINCVIHVHSPEIWQATQALQLPHTPANIAYGTPAMAETVGRLIQSEQLKQQALFTMLGHHDGVVAFGHDFAQTACVLLNILAASKQLF
ncbi:MAG: class II aldolase/adducin family protein [Methyloprofundus sp.]|nr:class II aldolase/adducin family protein [Methyloprofundus sp.]MBW6453654.1 class II aldolase/adducin family protein [Methyloprofundus sp.]